MDTATGNRIIALRARVVEKFDAGNWAELGLLTEASDLIDGHDRLLRSLSWGDNDYAGNALVVLTRMVERNPLALAIIEDYLDRILSGGSEYISAKVAERRITFAPHVFQIPDGHAEPDLVAVMMPFALEFRAVYEAIKSASSTCALRCTRVDDIWENSTIIQDIFSLIFRAQVVVVDFTGKNPNVMYETGIAHTLGKHVVPISQSLEDVPFDMKHHRVLKYLPNTEGLSRFSSDLSSKFRQVGAGVPVPPASPASPDDDVPF
jgi:hypothetical protein